MLPPTSHCFSDARRPELIEHEVATLVGQRVFGIAALGYEDLNDHDELRHDAVMAILAGKLEAKRGDRAPLAGKSTLNRLELSRPRASRYHKIAHDEAAIARHGRQPATPVVRLAYVLLCALRRIASPTPSSPTPPAAPSASSSSRSAPS